MGLTQTELGEKVGVKKNAVSKWECGRVEDIPTSTIKALASLFNVSPSYLIDDGDSGIYPRNAKPMPEMKKIPRVGRIACGDPITAEENIEELALRMTAEDFGTYTKHYPGLFFRLGTARHTGDRGGGLHSATFNPDEEAINYGIVTMAVFALEFLKDAK